MIFKARWMIGTVGMMAAVVIGLAAVTAAQGDAEEDGTTPSPTWEQTAEALGLSADQMTLTGEALADAIGLRQLVGFPIHDCQAFIETTDGLGYCLDAVTPKMPTVVHQSILAYRIQGKVLTEREIANIEEALELAGEAPHLGA